MKETKEIKKEEKKKDVKRGKHKAKATIGDIIFRVLIIVAIFFISVIAYVFYIRGFVNQNNLNEHPSQEVTRTIKKSN